MSCICQSAQSYSNCKGSEHTCCCHPCSRGAFLATTLAALSSARAVCRSVRSVWYLEVAMVAGAAAPFASSQVGSSLHAVIMRCCWMAQPAARSTPSASCAAMTAVTAVTVMTAVMQCS